MINVDAIKELIDQAPEIKTLFTIESYPVASMYDYNTGTHETSSILAKILSITSVTVIKAPTRV